MRVYVSAPVRAPRGDEAAYAAMRHAVEKTGHEVLHARGVQGELRGTLPVPDRQVFEHDFDLLQQADLLVADVSRPSLGVGWEIAWFLAKGRLVIACCEAGARRNLSVPVAGNPSPWQRILVYEDAADLESQLADFLR